MGTTLAPAEQNPLATAPEPRPRLGRNIGAQIAGRVAWLAASLILTPYLFGALGPRVFGVWSLLAGSAAVALLFDLGLGAALIRKVAASKGEAEQESSREALGLGLIAFAALALILLLLAWYLAVPLDRGLHLGLGTTFRNALVLTAGAAAAIGLSVPFAAVLDGNLRMELTAAATVLGSIAFAGVTVWLVRLDLGLVAPAFGLLAYAIFRGAVVAGLAWFYFPRLRPRLCAPDLASARELLGYGALVQVSNTAAVVNVESDRWVLAAFFSPTTVAPFEVGTKIIGLFRLLPSFALAAVVPIASIAHKTGRRDRLDRLYLRATRYLTLGATAGAALFVAGAAPLVTLWIGRPLDFARDVLWLLAPAFGLNLSTGAATLIVRAEGHPGRETRYALISLVLNIAFTVPLLLIAGRVGAIAGSAIGIFAASGYFFWYFHHVSKRPLEPLLRILWRPWVAATLAALTGLAAAMPFSTPTGRLDAVIPLLASAGAALVTYLAVLTALHFWEPADRAFVSRLAGRVGRAGGSLPRSAEARSIE
jgi:O-antigen/teichoic acid export membrane protein